MGIYAHHNKQQSVIETKTGIVTAVTRRYIDVFVEAAHVLRGKVSSKVTKACPGDSVQYEKRGKDIIVDEILPRKNLLRRSYGKATKLLAANIDHAFIITAPTPLFNTTAIDRVICAAAAEGIPCTLVVNKNDLEEDTVQTKDLIESYKDAGIGILSTNCIEDSGLQSLRDELQHIELSSVVFAGVSGAIHA